MCFPAAQTTWPGELADQPDCLWSVALRGSGLASLAAE